MSDGSLVVFAFLPAVALGILLSVEIGRRAGARRAAGGTEGERVAQTTLETAIYALLGLMVAFTFSGAASRFEVRRAQTVQEANAIGTAYLRLDLLPAAAQPALRERFRSYTQTRIAVYRVLPDIEASRAHEAQAVRLQGEIWSKTVDALREAPAHASILLLPALNDMIDITTTRAIAMRTHTPPVILGTLALLTLICSLLVGYGLAGSRALSSVLHVVCFVLVMTLTIYVILDLDYPRFGLIRLDYVDQALADVLAGMK